jgi:hypothetical protein
MEFSNSRLEKKGAPVKAGTRWKAVYPERLSAYALRYGRTVDCLKDWIRTGKDAGELPPLADATALCDWYGRYVAAVPVDLLAKWAPSVSPGQCSSGNGTRPLNLGQAIVEVQRVLAAEIQTLNQSSLNDSRRAVLLRNVQYASDSLCRLTNTLANVRRGDNDVLSWGTYAAGVSDIIRVLSEIRKGWPRRLFVEMEKLLCYRHYRILRALKEPLTAAAKKLCEEDILVFANNQAMKPVIEKMHERYRELEIEAAGALRAGRPEPALTFTPTDQRL